MASTSCWVKIPRQINILGNMIIMFISPCLHDSPRLNTKARPSEICGVPEALAFLCQGVNRKCLVLK